MPDLTSPFANAGFIVYRPFDEEVQELLDDIDKLKLDLEKARQEDAA